ncbi:hypothetical protein [Aliivibrio fischeri]|uniref:hypothetical protein n=1 Tax=Aliivibrio fischeri TaxID=668 RepID=UPI0009BE3E07|nr:hypothetical protein [Aliivibrio fischeri]
MQPSTIVDAPTGAHAIESALNQKAALRAERNRWFAITLSLVFVIFLSLAFSWFAFLKANNNKEIVYVKLAPNGSWSVTDYQPQDAQLYFKTTIDSLLSKYAALRYQINPTTIGIDWSDATYLMGDELHSEFLSKGKGGFNAAQKAAKWAKSRDSVTIKIRNIEHYDQITATDINGLESEIVRSNLYFTRTKKTMGKVSPPEHLVLSLQWQLMDKHTLAEQNMDFLRINPIGIQIFSQQLNIEQE